jgi:hypothetical protein
MKDLMNLIDVKRSISPVSVSDNTAQVGQGISRKGFDSVTYLINVGSVADADATFAVTMDESDDNSTYTAVAAGDLIGTLALASFQFDSDNKMFKVGYKGAKEWTRLTITPTNNASAALFSACAILGGAALKPTANPPA